MLPVVITVYSDRSFEFKIKSPPAAILLKLAAKIPHAKKAGGDVIPADSQEGRQVQGVHRHQEAGARRSPRRRWPT